MYMSFTYYLRICILCAHYVQWSLIYSFLTDNANVIHISSTLYMSYHVELSFCTLSTQMHIVNAICMLSAHVHIICLSSLTLLAYPIIHNLERIYILYAHYVQWSLTCFFLTDNAVDHNYLSTVTGTGYWMEFVSTMLSCFISGSCKWFER